MDECGFEVAGEGDFLFHRAKGPEVVPDIEADHNFDQEAYFLFAKWKGRPAFSTPSGKVGLLPICQVKRYRPTSSTPSAKVGLLHLRHVER